MRKVEPTLAEIAQDEAEIAAGIEDFVLRERSRGHAFLRGRFNVKRLDAIGRLERSGDVTAAQRSAGRRYGGEYAAFFDRSRYMSTLAYQMREADEDLLDRMLTAGLSLRQTRQAAFHSNPRAAAICDYVCGLGRVCPPDAITSLRRGLDLLAEFYAGDPEKEDFECHLPALLYLRDEGQRVLQRWVSWEDVGSRAAIKPVLLRAQAGRCAICDRPFGHREATLDHVYPRASGGADQPGNLLLLCEPCNRAKASRDPSPSILKRLAAANEALGWATIDQDTTSYEERLRRRILLDTLKRLEAYEANPHTPPRTTRRRSGNIIPQAPMIEPVWDELLPAKPTRSDRSMGGTWLREQGVLRRNRGNRKMGVNHGR